MNTVPAPTPLPLPAFQGGPGDSTRVPEHFLGHLRSVVSDVLSGGPSTRLCLGKKSDWVVFFVALSDSFMFLPLPEPKHSWSSWGQKIALIERTLEAVDRAFVLMDGIFLDPEILLDKILTRLLDLCSVFEVWAGDEVVDANDSFTPSFMKDRTYKVFSGMVRRLGDSVATEAAVDKRMWSYLQTFISKCLRLVQDLVSRPPLTPLTMVLSNTPRIRDVVQDPEPFNIVIGTSSQLNTFAVLALEFMSQAVCSSTLSQGFLSALMRQVSETARLVFDHCLSPACFATSDERVVLLTRIVAAVSPLHHMYSVFSGPLRGLPYRLLRFLLVAKPSSDNTVVDISAYAGGSTIPAMKADTCAALEMLRTENWGDAGNNKRDLVISFLRNNVPFVDAGLLRAIQDVVLTADIGSHSPGFVAQLEERQRHLSALNDATDKAATELEPLGALWRQQIRFAVGEMMAPDQIIWTDDDEDSTDHYFAQCALLKIKHRFEMPLFDASSNVRTSLAEQLGKLACLLTHGSLSQCLSDAENEHIATISPCLPLVSRLLEGPEDQVTNDVRRRVFAGFTRVIKHHPRNQSFGELEALTSIISHGLVDRDRSTRLAAGKALGALVELLGKLGQDLEPIFIPLYGHLDIDKLPLKETLLISVGSMGRTVNVEVLGQVLCLLIAQLGKQNPVLKGCAYMQLLNVIKFHNKSPYILLSPYLDKIAPLLVSRMCTQPELLQETCRLISVAPAEFVTINLRRTLPHLFGNCELKVLEMIARDLSKMPSTLFLDYSPNILAHIFRLETSQTNKALAFVAKVLSDAADRGSINIANVVKSSGLPLLAELVVGMGDEGTKADTAVAALKKVHRCMAPIHKGRTPSELDLGAYLKEHMLGLITHISEMVQEIPRKYSIQAKCGILRSLGALVRHIGPAISNIAPQFMATFQTTVNIPELSEAALESWHVFLAILGPSEIGPHIGPTSAAFVSSWPTLSPPARALVLQSLEYIVMEISSQLGSHLDDVVDLSTVHELHHIHQRLQELRSTWTPKDHLQRILDRSSSVNLSVATLSLGELKTFMLTEQDFIGKLASGDMFDPMVGQVVETLLAAACRDGDGTEALRLLAFECMGVLGAVDPDRCEIKFSDPRMIVLSNFTDEEEAVLFALHLIRDLLVGAFRSTSDLKYQSYLAYSIQELLRFCQFTPALIAAGNGGSLPVRVRNRWNSLPKHVLETVTPLLEGRFTLNPINTPDLQHPIYRNQSTYREWIQLWTVYLITKVSGQTAQKIFSVFRFAVRNKDVAVAHHVLPHLVLNILVSGKEEDTQGVRLEILAVLEDQVDGDSGSTADKKLLSAQAVFMLLDHLNKWVRIVRQDVSRKKSDNKRSRANQIDSPVEEQLLKVDSILSSIDQNLMARAALQCKAYARALMNFERQIVTLRERSPQNQDLPGYYERLHEIYSHLDEPDGMEGVSPLILSPSLEHQIRQHESTGRWTSAQSCWEVRLQQSPDNVDFHLGLLRCLRNLGHYDTLRTHVRGVLIRNPEWESALAGFHVESAWMVGAWDDVQSMVEQTNVQSSSNVIARLLLAMRAGDQTKISQSLSLARTVLGAPITAAGGKGYRRSYDAVLDLHITHELEMIHNAITALPFDSQGGTQQCRQVLAQLSRTLSARLDSTLPTFRTREPVLSMRRSAFAMSLVPRRILVGELGRSWLASAKIARKAGQWQTAYSAMLQAQQNKARFTFMESAKLVKVMGEPLRAIQELENSMRSLGLLDDNILDLTGDDEETHKMKAKAQVLRARWMNDSDRFEVNPIFKTFQNATELQPNWESGHFHYGQFQDECFKNLSRADQISRGMRMNLYTVRCFAKAIRFGSKYIYQTVPRLLTIWLDLGEDEKTAGTDVFKKLNDVVAKAIKEAPVYKWFTAFPQIVSRVGHSNPEVYKHLERLIMKVLEEYPKQALWLFTSVVKSTKPTREERGRLILEKLRNEPHNARTQLPILISQCLAMTNELLKLCDHHIDDDAKRTLSMSKDFRRLAALGRSPLIIPLQESLTASLPPTSSLESTHQPFPSSAPTFEEFADEIEIMRSLAKPRKITIRGSNGQIYMFLGKPKDDLRKDARLMDLNAIINKLLKANSESRRRQLHIRTYGVVTLNEECGFIQWVPNTIPIRPVLVKRYEARRIRSWNNEMNEIFRKIKDAKEKNAADLFLEKILPIFPPVFHDWFIETFPEPTAWLASRLSYGRTAAVMSMVGFILGLGDRHCENILLDSNTGDVVHVDFNCLFEKGKGLETPERVPFRLTQNMTDGLGVTGVEGVFRIACEITMQLLRDNKDSLMSVLDAFIHDPLVEWEDEKRKLDRGRRNQVKSTVDLHVLAKDALNPIEKKLKGIYAASKERQEKEISTSNLVQMLIQEATDPVNLAKMYPGWAAWH